MGVGISWGTFCNFLRNTGRGVAIPKQGVGHRSNQSQLKSR